MDEVSRDELLLAVPEDALHYGAAPHTGRGGWTWYTGSASWLYRVAVETILGSNCGVTHFVSRRACHRAGRDLN